MSDLEFRDALADLASLAETPDLTDRVSAGVRRRRQRRTIGAVASSAITVGAVIALTVTLTGPTGTKHNGPGPTVTPAAPHELPVARRVPAYTPPGARIVAKGPGGSPDATAAVFHMIYRVNRATISFVVIDDRRLPPCPRVLPAHLSHVRSPCDADVGWRFPFSPVADGYAQIINGRTAHVADEANHFGIQDIEWREGPYHYVLSSERLNLPSGPSGVAFEQLVRMARSVPTDPSVPAEPPLPNPPDVAIPASVLEGYHRYDRQLLDGNGASISYSRDPLGEFSIYVLPLTASENDPGPVNGLQDIDPARAKAQHAHLVHLRVRGRPAVGWNGPGDFVGLRAQIDGFTVGFLGRYGVTLKDYERIARTLQVIPHQP